ncbi:MAG: cell division protein ZapB [Deltaproteobacteria bacterium]|nr:cell division protein ZapB [Deltaproteobacteria bacterium]
MALERFDRLEEGISKLLGMCEGLKHENGALKEAVVEKEAEIRELSIRLKRLDKEKTTVLEKVDTLLGRLDALIQGA